MITLLTVMLACRPDPGDPSYPDPAVGGDDTADEDFLAGPDPYQEGDARLDLGLFYEGGASEALIVDDVSRHYYIYDGTYTQTVDIINRIEGYQSDVIVHAGGGYWGGGITWDAAEDLSGWTTLNISFASSSDTFASISVNFAGGGAEGSVQATDYGYAADGSWHSISIPLSAYTDQGVDLSSVTGPLILLGTSGEAGAELRVDNLYITAD